MGSFGYDPWESDNTFTAWQDIFEKDPTKIKTKLLKELVTKEGMKPIDDQTARYIANMIARLKVAGLLKDKELIRAAKSTYNYLVNSGWCDQWDKPKLIKKLIQKERKMLE